MEENKGIFDIKIQELKLQYSQIQKHILLCQTGNHDNIHKEIKKIQEECKENDKLLRKVVDNSRSKTLSYLAAAQLDYSNKVENILCEDTLGCQESAALFAEYALDFAAQTSRYALLAALNAVSLQMNEEEKKNRSDV